MKFVLAWVLLNFVIRGANNAALIVWKLDSKPSRTIDDFSYLRLRLRGGRKGVLRNTKSVISNFSRSERLEIYRERCRKSSNGMNCSDRTGDHRTVIKDNVCFERYYRQQGLVAPAQWEDFMNGLRKPLPLTFRITGQQPFSSAFLAAFERQYLSPEELNPTVQAPPEGIDPESAVQNLTPASWSHAIVEGDCDRLPPAASEESQSHAAAVDSAPHAPQTRTTPPPAEVEARRLAWYPDGRAIQVGTTAGPMRSCPCACLHAHGRRPGGAA